MEQNLRDDASLLQSLLDKGGDVTFPEGTYILTKTLFIRSHTHLHVPCGTVLRLGDGAECVLLENAGFRKGVRDCDISVTGGVWDGNNANQIRRRPAAGYDPDVFPGIVMRFICVDDLHLEKLTIKDPETYSMHLCNVEHFTVAHIRFDHNLLRANMDGVHVNGPARFGRIYDIHGATNDDLVALNCDDDTWCEPYRGDITDVEVDGLFAECGYTAVRLLSCGDTLRNVSISNIFGTYRFYAVSFTHHNIHPGEPILLENVSVRNIFASKPTVLPDEATTFYYSPSHAHWVETEPMIYFADGVTCRNITVQNVHRHEMAVTQAPTVYIGEGTYVENLHLSDVTQTFAACAPVPTVMMKGQVDNFIRERVQWI